MIQTNGCIINDQTVINYTAAGKYLHGATIGSMTVLSDRAQYCVCAGIALRRYYGFAFSERARINIDRVMVDRRR